MIGYAKMKGVPAPKAAILGTGVLLLVGGISMLLGVYPWVGLIALAIFLVGITFKMHQFWKAIDPMQKMGEEVNFYKNIALLGAVLMMFALPLPWPYSF